MSVLKLSLVDMNNGVANEATRCFRRIFDAFSTRVRAVNPSLDVTLQHVQPRNLGELPDRSSDLILSSGGPGAPWEGYEDPWCTGYREFLDFIREQNIKTPDRAPSLMVVCHSFELAVAHFKVAELKPR